MSYLNTKNKTVLIDGKKMAYRELGQRKSDLPLVMLVHLAATMDNWDPKLIDLVAQRQHVILLDLPGVGASEGQVATTIPGMATQAIAIIRGLGYERINLLGLSMGGMVAQEVVRQAPSLVNRLILAGTGPRGGLGLDRVTWTTFNYMAKAALRGTDPKRYIFYNHDAEGKQEADKVLGRLANRQADFTDKPMAIPGFLRQLKAIKAWSKERDDLHLIQQETLIVNGDKDMMVATENSYAMHQDLPNSRLIIYPNSGHGAIFQYADQFAQDLLDFLEGKEIP